MNDNQEILWNYYQEEIKQAINHESSRAAITNLILIISGIILSIITYDEAIKGNDLSLSVFLIVIGIFGIVFNAKYYERFNFHYLRAKGYRKLLENECPHIDFAKSRTQSEEANKKRFKVISRVRLNWLWLVLNLLISLFGIFLTLKILCN